MNLNLNSQQNNAAATSAVSGPGLTTRWRTATCASVVCLLITFGIAASLPAQMQMQMRTLDVLHFGQPDSESRHNFASTLSEITEGALQQPARRLLPTYPYSSDGGRLSFDMLIDPQQQNYVTLKLWGDEYGKERGRLYLFLENKMVGHRHLGDITPLDIASDEGPANPGRFYYTTLPLPRRYTEGKNSLRVEIRATGPVYAYGATLDKFQYPLIQPTRGIYTAYTHLDPCLMPSLDEAQGVKPEPAAAAPSRTTVSTKNPRQRHNLDNPIAASVRLIKSQTEEQDSVKDDEEQDAEDPEGEAFMAAAKKQVNHWLNSELRAKRPPSMAMMKFLARAYAVDWTLAYKNPKVIRHVVWGIDTVARRYQEDPDSVKVEWEAFGPCGDAIRLLHQDFPDGLLEEQIEIATPTAAGPADTVRRRDLWADMLHASREHRRMMRQHYTNQTMITDMNIYFANRGLQIIAPDRAFPEAEARRYLYEALGLEPWRGNDLPNGGHQYRWGEEHYVFTQKGLSRELGYVGYYGEIQSWALQLWEAVDYKDEQIRQQIIKLADARKWFRSPGMDAEGRPAMRLESIIGWRDFDYPGRILYGQETGREGSALGLAARLKDPQNVGYAQQMMADGQYFQGFENPTLNREPNMRTMMMNAVEEYETFRKLPPSPHRLPTSEGQPDFCFTDEENGVVALKHGGETLYVSLYWRARYGVNYLARVHHITPQFNRVVTAVEECRFTSRGTQYIRQNRVDRDFGTELTPAGAVQQALAGEAQSIAQEPKGLHYHGAFENHYSGRADVYVLRYGHYWIAMNTSSHQSAEVEIPRDMDKMTDLVSGAALRPRDKHTLKPLSSIVARLPDKKF